MPDGPSIGEIQRQQSAEYERAGVERWKAEHDERPADEKPKAVQGVGPTQMDENDPRPPPPKKPA